MTEIITVLRNMAGGTGSTGADLVTFGQDHIRALLAHIDAQATEIGRLRTALCLAVRQNECDMLMTGEELRLCRSAIKEAK